ncbi:hypothetical protein [Nonomuraea sp. NPDC049141]|uniref:hypothetical protein n=1 Tax=unclassified Nonomuraea TaxID=2593643 RepID=UPI0033F07A21
MMKKLATGLAAVAATSALALALPTAASASTTDDYSESWGPVYSQHYQAKASGWIGVEWDDDEESNTVTVKGKLWDLDNRSYDEGGKCAYVKFQASDFDEDWSTVYSKKYCGYPAFKRFSFDTDDASSIRVKVCQIGLHSSSPKNCGSWEYLYTNESE